MTWTLRGGGVTTTASSNTEPGVWIPPYPPRRSIEALAGADGRIEEAAKRLGVSRSTLFEKMRKLYIRSGIRLPPLPREPLGPE